MLHRIVVMSGGEFKEWDAYQAYGYFLESEVVHVLDFFP